MLDQNQIEEILKDPQKLQGLAKDMRAEADRLEAKAAGGDEVQGQNVGCCTAVQCVTVAEW